MCGPFESSLGGHRYFVSFVDDCSRFSHVFFLTSRDEVFDKTLVFLNTVTNLVGVSVKTLRSDNGAEYLSGRLRALLSSEGIVHQTYTPEQNGVAERYNRTVLEKAKAMLSDSGLDSRFWAYAVEYANFLRNVSPTSSLDGVTPFEAWHSRRPNLSKLRVFGCKAQALIPKSSRGGKLGSHSKPCIFLGLSMSSPAYVLFNEKSGRVFKSRNVLFNEAPPPRISSVPGHAESFASTSGNLVSLP